MLQSRWAGTGRVRAGWRQLAHVLAVHGEEGHFVVLVEHLIHGRLDGLPQVFLVAVILPPPVHATMAPRIPHSPAAVHATLTSLKARRRKFEPQTLVVTDILALGCAYMAPCILKPLQQSRFQSADQCHGGIAISPTLSCLHFETLTATLPVNLTRVPTLPLCSFRQVLSQILAYICCLRVSQLVHDQVHSKSPESCTLP